MLEISGLQKVVGSTTALDIPALRVEPGQITGIIGAQDSGKDLLLELLTGESRPSRGSIRFSGCDPATQRQIYSRAVGVIFSEDALYSNLSALSNLEFYCRLYNLPFTTARDVLAQVGMADQASINASKLPPTLARRLTFARAVLHHPKTLLAVEPFARCDVTSIAVLTGLLHQFADNSGSVLLIGTDLGALSPICDQVFLIQNGRLHPAELPQPDISQSQPFKIPVRLEDKVVLINPAESLYAETGEGRTFLVTTEGRLPTQFTLQELEERLVRSGFFRAHRGYLVNLQHIREVIPFTRNSFSLRLDDTGGTIIPLSKTAASELKDLLGY
jgi:ABC-2 type transport system ATP-binding protein